MVESSSFAIKYNNCNVNEPCSVCGVMGSANIPLDLFQRNTYDWVCLECGKKYAPELVKLLKYYYANEEGWDFPF